MPYPPYNPYVPKSVDQPVESAPLPGQLRDQTDRLSREFLSPQEQILRRAMQIGNFNYEPSDLNKLDIPSNLDVVEMLRAKIRGE